MTAPVYGEYNEDTCITAGDLRVAGLDVPEEIPDCAWIPRAAMRFGKVRCNAGPCGELVLTSDVTFVEPFRWVKLTAEAREKNGGAP